MQTIWNNKEYKAKRGIPYIGNTIASYGEPQKTTVFWYFYTPTGRISKYWTALTSHLGLKPETVANDGENRWKSRYKNLFRKGYTLSKPFIY
jgi:hypothetical protein